MVKVNRKDTSDPINIGRHRNSLGRNKNKIIKTFHISQQKESCMEKQTHNFKEIKWLSRFRMVSQTSGKVEQKTAVNVWQIQSKNVESRIIDERLWAEGDYINHALAYSEHLVSFTERLAGDLDSQWSWNCSPPLCHLPPNSTDHLRLSLWMLQTVRIIKRNDLLWTHSL